MKKSLLLATLMVASASYAQHVVVPNAYANTVAPGGSGLNTFIRDVNAPRTGQLLINANQLSSLVPGDKLTGLTFRLYQGSTSAFPHVDATWSDYSIWIGQGVAPLAGSTTFSSNFLSTPQLVRSGALTIPANSFGTTGTPRPWGFDIMFQNPFTYMGGHLTVEIRHTGSNITNQANSFLEAVTTTDPGYVAGDFRSYTATTYAATTGTQATFTVTRFSVDPVPEPGTMAALGLGVAALLRRRVRRT
jgi:hypothetical protein